MSNQFDPFHGYSGNPSQGPPPNNGPPGGYGPPPSQQRGMMPPNNQFVPQGGPGAMLAGLNPQQLAELFNAFQQQQGGNNGYMNPGFAPPPSHQGGYMNQSIGMPGGPAHSPGQMPYGAPQHQMPFNSGYGGPREPEPYRRGDPMGPQPGYGARGGRNEASMGPGPVRNVRGGPGLGPSGPSGPYDRRRSLSPPRRGYGPGTDFGPPPTRDRREGAAPAMSPNDPRNRERPGRTLFVRSVKYDTKPQDIRDMFERFGEIRSFYDIIGKRGMAFVSYYDLRAAQMAKERLQGTQLQGRPIDVHFGVPRDEDRKKACQRDDNQGTLFLTVTGAQQPIDDAALGQMFGQFGDLRDILPSGANPHQRFIEYFDARGAETAFDKLKDTPFLGGTLDLKYAWDYSAPAPPSRMPETQMGAPRPNAPLRPGEHNGYNSPHQQGAPMPSMNGRLEQAHKVQELLASLAPGGANGLPAGMPAPPQQSAYQSGPPPMSSPVAPAPAPAPAPAAAVPAPAAIPPALQALLDKANGSLNKTATPSITQATKPPASTATPDVNALLAMLAKRN
ncbi:uncharacterized protein L969DRAFT_88965 [Mixia osmundae IAM 14324]|uniref:RRM domain-containing protein n=1 Tax=Mixia osmundae (strain CBS 9802 / IAM 14324 / JCM 22182 / KY 12970) TaxID=764103 RepID=G7E7V7_MIXOS|nr:uncharacterized protein L969DRAFT_88965 [Mixia osmundae IAM 14324]KEI38518.1 hypothetical protein L969DRAFT_88965 [Mixia osmundae IAM 14324]GAA98917.1 hypothetical protein E5Q_05605 [Mixia osmundae IAM 14324]